MKDELREAVGVVALLNLAYFGVEFGVALMIGSVSLFADSIDFLEDASSVSYPRQETTDRRTFCHSSTGFKPADQLLVCTGCRSVSPTPSSKP